MDFLCWIVWPLILMRGFRILKKFKTEFAEAHHSEKLYLLKPQTFMNLSGESVGPFSHFYKISPQDVLAIYDDLDLPLGRIRFATGGGAGGHNGIKSLIECLGTKDFPRLRLGIGRPRHAKMEVNDHVLSRFSQEEDLLVDRVCWHGAQQGVLSWLDDGIRQAMNRHNGLDFSS